MCLCVFFFQLLSYIRVYLSAYDVCVSVCLFVYDMCLCVFVQLRSCVCVLCFVYDVRPYVFVHREFLCPECGWIVT